MDAMEKHVLEKLDEIRADQIRGLERVDEIRNLLRTPPAPVMPVVSTTTEMGRTTWLPSVKPFAWLWEKLVKHFPAIATIAYMKATGQDAKILLYINGLLGI